jgi:L-ribulose-5-phosphate 3-epimerase
MTCVVSFMTANYVARQTGYAMHGWGHGDRTSNEWYAPLDTYEQRFGELLADVSELGFEAIDLWGAHLHQAWATDEHVAIARSIVDANGLTVSSYATYLGAGETERVCEIATALGTTLLGGMASDLPGALPVLRERGLRLGIENHPERSPDELLEKIGDAGDVLGATIDTGWWATQGYDAARAIEELRDHVLHVHLKDVRATGEPHETCRWGEGIVPIEECVQALRRIDYQGGIAVEHEPELSDPSADCGAMRLQLEEWLR